MNIGGVVGAHNKVKISVLIAAYNADMYIAETLSSLQAQTYGDFEVIVVDDGSIDLTGEIVNRFCLDDSRFKLVSQNNNGAGAARNLAFQHSSGDYIVILDADDRVLPEKFEIQSNYLDANPDVGVVYSDTYFCDAQGNRIALESNKWPERHCSGDIFGKIINSNVTAVHAAMVRRVCLERVGLHQVEKDLIGDWDLWVRIAEYYPFHYQDLPLADYRIHENMSQLSTRSDLLSAQVVATLEENARRERFSLLSPVLRADYYYGYGKALLRCRRARDARFAFGKSIRLDPVAVRSWLAWLMTFAGNWFMESCLLFYRSTRSALHSRRQ